MTFFICLYVKDINNKHIIFVELFMFNVYFKYRVISEDISHFCIFNLSCGVCLEPIWKLEL